jgi:RNA polymerase sigma-70 factor (ECF subfamily)
MTISVTGILHPVRAAHSVAGEASTDNTLIRRIAAGDKLALRILMARHQVSVYRFVLRILRDEARAEDVVSEVFFEVWRRAGRFEGRSSVSTWLFAIAHNLAISALRHRSEVEIDSEMASEIADPADDPEGSTGKKQLRAFVQECLSRLSQAHREVIDLVYYHEMSIDDVAEILQIPAGTVKTRMFYARSQLSRLLEQGGITRSYSVA